MTSFAPRRVDIYGIELGLESAPGVALGGGDPVFPIAPVSKPAITSKYLFDGARQQDGRGGAPARRLRKSGRGWSFPVETYVRTNSAVLAADVTPMDVHEILQLIGFKPTFAGHTWTYALSNAAADMKTAQFNMLIEEKLYTLNASVVHSVTIEADAGKPVKVTFAVSAIGDLPLLNPTSDELTHFATQNLHFEVPATQWDGSTMSFNGLTDGLVITKVKFTITRDVKERPAGNVAGGIVGFVLSNKHDCKFEATVEQPDATSDFDPYALVENATLLSSLIINVGTSTDCFTISATTAQLTDCKEGADGSIALYTLTGEVASASNGLAGVALAFLKSA